MGVLLPSAPFFGYSRIKRSDLWAATYGMFHWGPVGWALYCLPTLAISCAYYLSPSPSLRLSAACSPGLGPFQTAPVRRFIDLLFIVGLLGSAATGLGFGTAVATSALTRLAGIPDDFTTQLALIAVITVLISISVYRGLDGGSSNSAISTVPLRLSFSRLCSSWSHPIYCRDESRGCRPWGAAFPSNADMDRSITERSIRRELDRVLLGLVARAWAFCWHVRLQDF